MTEPTVERLEPCPFCGPAAKLEPFFAEHRGGYWYVSCLYCDCEGPPTNSKDDALAAWNRRALSRQSSTEAGEVVSECRNAKESRQWNPILQMFVPMVSDELLDQIVALLQQPAQTTAGPVDVDDAGNISRPTRDLLFAPLSLQPPAQTKAGEPHPDDVAVDKFAAAMKAKLAKKRADGRSGWDNPRACSVEHLAELLVGHVIKGDPLDVGNLAMMLWNRGCEVELLRAAKAALTPPQRISEEEREALERMSRRPHAKECSFHRLESDSCNCGKWALSRVLASREKGKGPNNTGKIEP
jgi:Lar family restriction alleviation protein